MLRQSSEIIYLLFIRCILLHCVVFYLIFPPRCATRVRHLKEYSIGLIPWMQYVCYISHGFVFVYCIFSCIVCYLFLLLLLLFLLLSPYADMWEHVFLFRYIYIYLYALWCVIFLVTFSVLCDDSDVY